MHPATASEPMRTPALKAEDICKAFAQDWYDEKRSALLIVPSIPARIERNFLINPAHADAKGITHSLPAPVWWDERLYARR